MSEVTPDQAPVGASQGAPDPEEQSNEQQHRMYGGRPNLAASRWLFMRSGSKARVGTARYTPRALAMLSPLMLLTAAFMVLVALLASPRVFHLYSMLSKGGLASAWVPAACPKPTHIFKPTWEADVVSIVGAALKRCPRGGLSIRASRQGWHSNALFPCADEAASCESIQLDMTKMNQVLEVNEKKRLVCVQPGVLLNEVMDALQAHHNLNFRPEYMTIYTGLTVGGMVLAAAHGSSVVKPSAFGNLLQALSFVDGRGKLHKVSGPEAREFIGSTGMFGIVTELTLSVDEPIKHFMSVMKRSDAHFEAELPQLLSPDSTTGLFQRSLWFPHAGDMITKRHMDMPADVPGEAQHTFFRPKPLFAELAALGIKMDQLNFLQGLLPTDKLICFTMRNVPGVWYSEHSSYVPWNQSMVGSAHDLTGSSCVGNNYGCYWHDMAQVLLELDMSWDNLLPWMGDVRKIVSYASGCLPSLLGFTLRFGKASEHPLDMAYGRNTVYVDILVSKGFAAFPAVHQDLFDEIEQMSLIKYEARPHWGKNPVRAFLDPRASVASKYPLFQDMVDKARKLDPYGIFLSPLHKALIAKEGTERFSKAAKKCAVHYLCYCSKDADCGAGHLCAEGRVYPEFKVCRRKPFWFA